MHTRRTPSKSYRDPRKAVAPDNGAATFFCSTESKDLSNVTRCFAVSLHFPPTGGILGNLLPNKHYFRPGLAKQLVAIVVLTEGKKRPLGKIREVAA